MIDFQNPQIFKLRKANADDIMDLITPMLVDGETVFSAFKGIRDWVVFTDKRIISINVQGVTGKKKDFTSLPYS